MHHGNMRNEYKIVILKPERKKQTNKQTNKY